MNELNYPKVGLTKDKKAFVLFFINDKRYRLFNGKRVNSKTSPNKYPLKERESIANILAAEVYRYLKEGGVLNEFRSDAIVCGNLTDLEYLQKALDIKLKGDYSAKYKSMMRFTYNKLKSISKGSKINSKEVKSFLSKYSSISHNTLRRHLNVLINEAIKLGMESNPMEGIKAVKAKANLNKPFNDIEAILEEIRGFNQNLYLCCVLTYGCLLRPHREVRELTWGDFTEDLSYIKLSGSRNKSGRNRIVPVPYYVKELLKKEEPNHNIFSGTTKPLNADYFKTVWGRFKKVSLLLEQDQTLYSFRHSGAINIFKRTGSLSKLQKAMGHSNMMVSMTYLRGLEISELEESDMPLI
jgi:integrase